MRTKCILALALIVAGTAMADPRRFVASDVPAAKLKKPGKVVITNDARSITAWRFFGNIREALFTLRSTRTIVFRPFGKSIFDTRATAKVPPHVDAAIHHAARQHGVDPRLVAAIARRESAFDPRAVSNRGACGIMQLMPATAAWLGVTDVFDVQQNVSGGTRYLRTLLDAFGGDLDLALAAYNAGPGAVQKYRGIPPYRETQSYVAAVRKTYEASLRAQ